MKPPGSPGIREFTHLMSHYSAVASSIKVLIVDDSKHYRNAFRRNLMMRDYQVVEAQNADEALKVIERERPHVLITDLQMRTHDEGLNLIRLARATDPLMPVIMISAVGTFEEGAEASRLGAVAVVHKSRIEEEIEDLYQHINKAYDIYSRDMFALRQIDEVRAKEVELIDDEDRERLRAIMTSTDRNEYIRTEAFDAFQALTEEESQRAASETVRKFMPQDQAGNVLDDVEAIIETELPSFVKLLDESAESLRNAEFLYQQQAALGDNIDFSRNIGFSYCFAVENEAKARLKKRMNRFLAAKTTPRHVAQMLDRTRRGLNLFFHQNILRAQRGHELEITIDNVKQTLQRIDQHGPRYRPDGLKALGILVLCFARDFEFVGNKRERVLIQNPLGLKGIGDNDEVMRFCQLLISLQHYRNPYIHPEITDLAKLSNIRQTAYLCLTMIAKLV